MSLENFHPAGYFARLTLMSPRCTTSMWTPPFSTCSSGWSSERLSPLVVVDMSVLPHVRRSRDPTPRRRRPQAPMALPQDDSVDRSFQTAARAKPARPYGRRRRVGALAHEGRDAADLAA